MFSFNSNTSLASTTTTSSSIGTNITSNGALYCRVNDRHLLELTVDKKLNLITPPREDSPSVTLHTSITNSRHLYTLPAAFISETAIEIKANNHSASSVAISFANQSILVVNGLLGTCISLSIINAPAEVAWFDWHPLSPNDSHLLLLLRSGHLNLYATNDDGLLNEEGNESDPLPRLIEPESSIKLNQNRFDPLIKACFAPASINSGRYEDTCNWTRFGVFLCSEAGEVHFTCPVIPASFKAKRQDWLHKLAQNSEGMPKKWSKESLLSAKLLSLPGDEETDWILASIGPSFSHLIPSVQGPLSIQPEPLEIHHLASYDRVCDFRAFLSTNGDIILAIAFASGKIDLLLLGGDDDLLPAWQLVNQVEHNQESIKAYLVLLESIDVHSTSSSKSAKRPVDAQVKFISPEKMLVSPGDGRVIEIKVELSDEISVSAEVIIASSKATPQVALQNRLFPGAILLPESSSKDEASLNVSSSASSSLTPVLERINRQAFPLGKMEIEGASLQLSSLLESTTKTLKRLKDASGDVSSCKSKLPDAVKEADCGVLNEQVNKWQQEIVMPALRIGHELALRVEELVQILRTERQVLTRAHDLLTSKPERLESLLKNISTAKERHEQLKRRLESLQKQIPPTKSGRLGDSALLPVLERMKSELGKCMTSSGHDKNPMDVVNVQLSLQSEVLHKLQRLLK